MKTKDYDYYAGFFNGQRGPFRESFRASRGMMEPTILNALLEKAMHGYEVITYLEEKSHGVWRPSPGSVYPTLQLLEEKGDVSSNDVDGKKIYELTPQGKTRADEFSHLRENWKEGFSERARGAKDGRKLVGQAMHLMRDIYRKGSVEQNQALGEAIENFKNRLEQIKKGEL